MKIGLIDVDGHNFPNLPLMKLSAWHKQQGDLVEWYSPMFSGHMNKVYMSKVFTFTPDYEWCIDADEIIKSGTGYFYPDGGPVLPEEIEHIYPDYSLYPDLCRYTAYGFLTRGCPRNCNFCIVGKKEGCKSIKVANLSEFWNRQKNIKLLDPNITACQDWKELFEQLVESRAWIDFTQGVDIRMMTDEKAELIRKIKLKIIHFAWDDYGDKDIIVKKLKRFREITGWDHRKMSVYILIGFNSTIQEDLERIYTVRDLGFSPYVMIYEKEKLPPGHALKKIQIWVNAPWCFRSVERFEDYIDK
jgi:hypothetical protein